MNNQNNMGDPNQFNQQAINQPNSEMNIQSNGYYGTPQQPVQTMNTLESGKQSGLGIAAFILTLLGCTAFIGLILAIIDVCQKDGKRKTLSKISLGICGFWIAMVLLGSAKQKLSNKNDESKFTPEITTEETLLVTEATTEQTTELITEVTTEMTTEVTSEASEDASETPNSQDAGIVTPEFKESMDSYEAFFDEYIAFMNKYTSADADDMMNMMADYGTFLARYSEAMSKMEAIDQDELSYADQLYYIEVTTRINEKLMKVAVTP